MRYVLSVFFGVAGCLWAQVAAGPSGALINTKSTAFNAVTGKTYVVDDLGSAVWVLDARRLSAKKVDVGAGPSAVVVSEATGRAYAALKATGEVVVLDGKTDEISSRLKVGPHPYTLAIDDRRRRVYIGSTSTDVFAVINIDDGEVQLQQGFGAEDQLAVDTKTGKVLAIEYGNPNLKIYDPEKKQAARVYVGEHLWGLAVSELTGIAYVTRTSADELVAVNEQTHQKRVAPVGKIPCAVEIDDKTNRVLVLNYGDNTLSILDARTLAVLYKVAVGSRPQALCLDRGAGSAYVASLGNGTVARIDEATGRILATKPAGLHPYGVQLSAKPNLVYAADLGSPAWTAVRF